MKKVLWSLIGLCLMSVGASGYAMMSGNELLTHCESITSFDQGFFLVILWV